jgi:hypothetical protein
VQLDVIGAVDAIGAAGVPVIARGTRGGAIHSIFDDRLGADRTWGLSAGEADSLPRTSMTSGRWAFGWVIAMSPPSRL